MVLRIYTDGACSGNPGPGGWSAIINLREECKNIYGGEKETTNNRMELTAAIQALLFVNDNRLLEEYNKVEIYSDSAYVVNAIKNKWLNKWKSNGWKTAKSEAVANSDLWKKMSVLYENLKDNVVFVKVKGHDGDTFNEMADKIAREQALLMKKER